MLGIVILTVVLASAKATRPNIVFIMADDLGYNDIGYHARLHDSDMKTPYLDKLAAEGIKLENYYVQPICTPSRSQLMSGRYQIHTGLQHGVLMAGQRNGLPLDNKLLSDQLLHCGYDTHMVGKWHLGDYEEAFLPQYRGFNSYFGYLNGAEDYYTHTICRKPLSCGVDMRDTYGPLNSTWGKYSAFTFTDRAKQVIDIRDRSKPMFLYLAFQSVHFPLQVPDEYVQPFMYIKDKKRRTYAGMVATLDEAVKNVTEHLRSAGILDNTIIIFSTDNGGRTDFGGNNWPLRGQKATLWEGGVKGVGFITGKPLQMANVTANNFMHVSDWFPTILSATECPQLPGTQPLDGFDQWNAILQKETSPRGELLHNIDPLEGGPTLIPKFVDGFDITVHAAVRSGPWKLLTGDPGFDKWVRPPESKKSRDSTDMKVPWKTRWVDPTAAENYDKKVTKAGKVQLFHIESDPYERHEVSTFFPTVVSDLLQKLAKYNSTAVPARYPSVDKKADPKYHGGYWGPWINGRH